MVNISHQKIYWGSKVYILCIITQKVYKEQTTLFLTWLEELVLEHVEELFVSTQQEKEEDKKYFDL